MLQNSIFPFNLYFRLYCYSKCSTKSVDWKVDFDEIKTFVENKGQLKVGRAELFVPEISKHLPFIKI